METAEILVAPWKTAIFAALLVAMIACLALEEKLRSKKSLITGLFAVTTIFLGAVLGVLPFEAFARVFHAWPELFGEGMPIYIPSINWEVIAIILGSSIFVDVTSRSGLFTWIAIRLTRASRGDPLYLLIGYSLMTVVFSAVLNNVTAMIIVGSLTAVSLRKLEQTHNLLGFLLIEALLTNVGGLLTLISSVPNIIVGNTAGISFVSFFLYSTPYVVVATGATIWLGVILFGITRLESDVERQRARERVDSFDETDGISSWRFFAFSAVMGALLIATFASASFLPYLRDLGLGYVALTFAAVVLASYKHEVDRFYSAVDWDLIGFFTSLFIVIHVMEYAGVLAVLGRGIEALVGLGERAGPIAILWSSALASSVTDNIPLAAMLAKIMDRIPDIAGSPDSPFWWSVILGANLGGNLTPIGSASTVGAVTVMHKYGVTLGFPAFVRAAVPYAVLQLVMASGYVLLRS